MYSYHRNNIATRCGICKSSSFDAPERIRRWVWLKCFLTLSLALSRKKKRKTMYFMNLMVFKIIEKTKYCGVKSTFVEALGCRARGKGNGGGRLFLKRCPLLHASVSLTVLPVLHPPTLRIQHFSSPVWFVLIFLFSVFFLSMLVPFLIDSALGTWHFIIVYVWVCAPACVCVCVCVSTYSR